jgi:multicomponent K+:H+ antiporter subunit F
MIGMAVSIALLLFAVAMLLAAWRLLRGPDILDRVLALETLYTNAIAVVILLGLKFATQLYFEAALLMAMLGFIGTVVTARFVGRGDVIDHD